MPGQYFCQALDRTASCFPLHLRHQMLQLYVIYCLNKKVNKNIHFVHPNVFCQGCIFHCFIPFLQPFSYLYPPHHITPLCLAVTKNKAIFLILVFFLCPPSSILSVHASLSLSLSNPTLPALPPPACLTLICHIYNGNIQIYRCYQLITSSLITIQLTSVSMCHAVERPAPPPPPPTQSHYS